FNLAGVILSGKLRNVYGILICLNLSNSLSFAFLLFSGHVIAQRNASRKFLGGLSCLTQSYICIRTNDHGPRLACKLIAKPPEWTRVVFWEAQIEPVTIGPALESLPVFNPSSDLHIG